MWLRTWRSWTSSWSTSLWWTTGLPETERGLIRAFASRPGIELIENGENLGIATAMNVGIRRGQKLGCRWVLLFDQDSCVTDGFVDAMVSGFETLSAEEAAGDFGSAVSRQAIGECDGCLPRSGWGD